MSLKSQLLLRPCKDERALRAWLKLFLNLKFPFESVCSHHNTPFDYLKLAYFEPARDLVVWAPRGGGKTRLAALATLLDLLHKPEVSVRILAGSLEQSMRTWDYLMPDLEKLVEQEFAGKPKPRSVKLKNAANASILAQSQRAVRGLRVQKLRCDEVELFKPDIWEAAQLVTRSTGKIGASIDALSTLHTPWGLMHAIVEGAESSGKTVLKWCILDVLEKCPPERDCAACPLWNDCQGLAKVRCNGHVKIEDAIKMKQRVSLETWESEMLCKRPSVRGRVFSNFKPDIHVSESRPPSSSTDHFLAVDFGYANPFVCLFLEVTTEGHTHVHDEYVQKERPLDDHIQQLRLRLRGPLKHLACDPAGAGRNDQTAESNIQLLRKNGFTVKHRKSLIVEGLELIRRALSPATGSPTLTIHPRCEHLIKAMTCYRYETPHSELPLKDGTHDHLIDALRYHFVNQPRFASASRIY